MARLIKVSYREKYRDQMIKHTVESLPLLCFPNCGGLLQGLIEQQHAPELDISGDDRLLKLLPLTSLIRFDSSRCFATRLHFHISKYSSPCSSFPKVIYKFVFGGYDVVTVSDLGATGVPVTCISSSLTGCGVVPLVSGRYDYN